MLSFLKRKPMNNNLYYHIKLELGDTTYRLAIQERPQDSSNSVWFVEARIKYPDRDEAVRSVILTDEDAATLRRTLDLNRFIVTVQEIIAMESWDARKL